MRGRVMAIAAVGTAGTIAAVATYHGLIRPWYERWGSEPEARLLPGDELISAPTGGDTRSIEISAPAAAIWPWLVQMGYGRGGWYSYDALDMRGPSAERIEPSLQALTVGDTVPTWPGGGFEVIQVEPERALVLYLDDEVAARQAQEAQAVATDGVGVEALPPGLAVSTAILRSQPRRFRASWAFVLEPIDGDRTRLIQRFRVEYPEVTAWNRVIGPVFGIGVFLMTRRQMLGIKERAERLVEPETPPPGHAVVIAEPAGLVATEPGQPEEAPLAAPAVPA